MARDGKGPGTVRYVRVSASALIQVKVIQPGCAGSVFVQSFGEVLMFSRTPHAPAGPTSTMGRGAVGKARDGAVQAIAGEWREGGHDVKREGAMRVASGFWRLLSVAGRASSAYVSVQCRDVRIVPRSPPSQRPRPTPAASQTWADAARSRAGLPTGACERPASQLLNGRGGRRFVERRLARRQPTLKPTA